MDTNSFILIGPGNIGLSITSLLMERDYYCDGVISRTPDGEEEIRQQLGEQVSIHIWEDWEPVPSDFILVATPDDTLEEIGVQLAQKYLDAEQADSTFIHFSGIQSSEVFQPLREHGYRAASFHPLQSVPTVKSGRKGLLGCAWAFEGDSKELCQRLVDTLHGSMTELTAENKVPYHLAAVFASNMLVALEAMAVDIAGEAGISQDKFLQMFAPLIRRSLDNVLEQSPEQAITGPLKRADSSTIDKHLAWLNDRDQKYRTVYSELSHYLMEVLLAEDTITLQDVDELTQILDDSA
ncbi:MAG: DUF2520 domain-containing protein [Candidatus Marinimicrobia bacterium]|nr:DUF2520 domain-containing protein [Candidatus Neomarinimicrobiota bacterium]MCF7880215.1 DUF2520 domain-containing protein [Candidatus Neomarinimicrobiota bacterium]